jgi:hypothetical protein
MEKSSKLKKLFDLIDKAPKELRAEMKKTLGELIEIDDSLDELVEASDKTSEIMQENSASLDRLNRRLSDVLQGIRARESKKKLNHIRK